MPGFPINPQLLVLCRFQTARHGKTIRNYSHFLAKVPVYPQLAPRRRELVHGKAALRFCLRYRLNSPRQWLTLAAILRTTNCIWMCTI